MRISLFHQKPRRFLTFLVLCFCFVTQALAQAPGVNLTTTVTPSDCKATGSITVNLTGWEANYENPNYAVKEKSGKYTSSLQSSNILSSLPAGSYDLTVRLKKKGQEAYVEMTKSNIVVGGSYVELTGGFDGTKSRPSLPDCGTGSLYVNVSGTNANDLSKLKFFIKSTDLGISEHAVSVTKVGNNSYKLTGENYKAGKYNIVVKDGCMDLSIDATLPGLPLPTFSPETEAVLYNGISAFDNGTELLSDCNNIVVKLALSADVVNNKQLFSYAYDGAFEVALSPEGVEPTNDQYQTLTKIPNKEGSMRVFYKLSLGAGRKLTDYYGKNLKIKVRIKNCPSVSREFSFPLKLPVLGFPRASTSSSVTYPECGMRTVPFITYQTENLFCFPINVVARELDDRGNIKSGGHTVSQTLNSFREDPTNLKIYLDRPYRYDITDANGTYVANYKYTWEHNVQKQPIEFIDCMAQYILPFRLPSFRPCIPYDIKVRRRSDNKEVQTINVTTNLQAVNSFRTVPLDFKQYYDFSLVKDGKVIYQFNHSEDFNRNPILYNSVTGEGYCGRDRGTLRVEFEKNFQTIKKLTVLKDGKAIATGVTIDPNTKKEVPSNIVRVESAVMPKGNYILKVETEGCSYEVPFAWNGFYNREDFKYTSTRTCEGLEVTPTGRVTHEGKLTYVDNKVTKQVPTYFRIIAGPAGGYQQKSYPLGGEKIMLTVSGKYKLVITESYKYGTCGLDTIDIDYKEVSVQFSTPHNAAYACKDGAPKGHILVKGMEGVPPYSYELWKADRSAPIENNAGTALKPLDINASGVAHFAYGKASEEYAIKVTDKCGTSNWQNLTISDLTSLDIASTPTPVVCAGDVIMLEALPLVNFKWYRPGDMVAGRAHFSTEQNPMIFGARVEDSGIYEVRVDPPYCGSGFTGSVTIKVIPCSAPVNPHLMQKVQRRTAP